MRTPAKQEVFVERSDGRRRRQRGAQAVEAGLVLFPLCALTFMILDLSFVLFVKCALQHSVREGVRFAVTGRTLPGMWHDDSIKSVVQGNSVGFLTGASGASKIRIRYFQRDTLVETANNIGGNVIEITIEGFTWRPMAPFMRSGNPVGVSAIASDIMEPSPGGIAPRRS
jgi:hypothetical protein